MQDPKVVFNPGYLPPPTHPLPFTHPHIHSYWKLKGREGSPVVITKRGESTSGTEILSLSEKNSVMSLLLFETNHFI
jgi:hypothetical protein